MIRRASSTVLAVVCLLAMGARAAHAQAVGFQVGAALDPSQWYAGTHADVPLAANISLRPSIEGASGAGVSEALIDVSFIYSFPLGPLSAWSIYQGTGPVIVLERIDGEIHPHGGFSGVVGVEHHSGFFFEFKLSGGGGPNLRMGVGYTLRHRTP